MDHNSTRRENIVAASSDHEARSGRKRRGSGYQERPLWEFMEQIGAVSGAIETSARPDAMFFHQIPPRPPPLTRPRTPPHRNRHLRAQSEHSKGAPCLPSRGKPCARSWASAAAGEDHGCEEEWGRLRRAINERAPIGR